MEAKIIKFPINRKSANFNTKTREASSFQKPKKNVKKIDEIKREEERVDQMFPPNFLTLIMLGNPN